MTMFRSLSKNEFIELAKQRKYVGIYRELLADATTPIAALESLTQKNESAMLLESGTRYREAGAYSFIGMQPYASFSTHNGVTTITADKVIKTSREQPLSLLRDFQQQYHCALDQHADTTDSGLIGQMMGFLGYDAVRYFENLPDSHADDESYPEILFHFYRINLIFNHEKNKLLLAIIVETTADLAHTYDRACAEINAVILKLENSANTIPQTTINDELSDGTFDTDCSDEVYAEKVQQAKAYIQAGDAFQIVLSRTFYKSVTVAPLAIYRILRYSNPTPYMFYVSTPDFVLFGASPEKLVSVHDKEVTITPIAGTIPLTHDTVEEGLLEKFRNDPKERAEHMMLVDLARNDIGAVCKPGSVKVAELMCGQKLTYLMHLVSYVKGQLAEPFDAFDVLKYAFPAGTLSGAPKIRAMEIIDELEISKRNLYGGAICKIDSKGNLDSCIIIRSAVVKDGILRVRAGAGIVFDSNPSAEAAETRHKARGMLRAINMAVAAEANVQSLAENHPI